MPAPYGEIVRIGPNYDPNLTFAENRAAGNVETIGRERLAPQTKIRAGAPAQVVLLDSFQQEGFVNTNPNWGKPNNYQPVRSFRFSLRFTF